MNFMLNCDAAYGGWQEAIGNMARNLRALVTKNSMKERYKTAQTYLKKMKFLIEDVSFPVRLRFLERT